MSCLIFSEKKKKQRRKKNYINFQMSAAMVVATLTFTLWANSADNKFMIIFLFSPENWIFIKYQVLSSGKNKKKIFQDVC